MDQESTEQNYCDLMQKAQLLKAKIIRKVLDR